MFCFGTVGLDNIRLDKPDLINANLLSMSEIKGHTRKGSLLRINQRALPDEGKSLEQEQELLIPQDKNRVFKTKDAAKYLNLSVRTFTQYVIDHEIPFVQWSPRVRRFFVSDLDKVALSLKTKKRLY